MIPYRTYNSPAVSRGGGTPMTRGTNAYVTLEHEYMHEANVAGDSDDHHPAGSRQSI